jgi:hypothetical protein
MRNHLTRRVLTAVATIIAAGTLAAPAMASGTDNYCTGTGLSSGASCASPTYEGSILSLEGWSSSGLTGVWVQNGAGARVSADVYCNVSGCRAVESWGSSTPNGYPVVHNHGSGYNTFYAEADWN